MIILMPLRTQQEQRFLDSSHRQEKRSAVHLTSEFYWSQVESFSEKKNSLDRLQTEILLCPSLVHKFTSLHVMERKQGAVNFIFPSMKHGHRCGVVSTIRNIRRINNVCDTLLYKTLHISFITTAWNTVKSDLPDSTMCWFV